MDMEMVGCLAHLLVTVFLTTFAGVLITPAITDVIMAALCPGKDECSLAIFLTGIQQAVIGLGTLVMTPVLGNLSDQYGRKTLLTLPLTLSIIPHVILAYSRTKYFFFAYYITRTLTSMICDGSVLCLALAYLADNISEKQRGTAFGVLSGVMSTAVVGGTLAARFLAYGPAFKLAAVASILSALYMRIFLKDTPCDDGALVEPILKSELSDIEPGVRPIKTLKAYKNIPSPGDMLSLLRRSKTFSQAAIVAFFSSLCEGGVQVSLMFFLKARFHFIKDQFAVIILIAAIGQTISQLVLMPLLATSMGEEKLLSLGLLVGCVNIALHSIAWSPWVPYAVSGFFMFASFTTPCVWSIVSKQVGPNEQGIAQGCISSLKSFAHIISPLMFSPLTAFFLSEDAPLDFPGFSIMCLALVLMIAFVQSLLIAPVKVDKDDSDHVLA